MFLLPLLFVAGCDQNQTDTQTTDTSEEEPTKPKKNSFVAMSPEELKSWKKNHDYPYAIIDLRSKKEYNNGHIYQSDHLQPGEEATGHVIKELDPSRPRVAYGTSNQQAQKFLSKLKENGYQDLMFLKGGIKAWKDAGFTLTGKKLKPEAENENGKEAQNNENDQSDEPELLKELGINPGKYERLEQRGEPVPLMPIKDAKQLYNKQKVYFIDARGISSYRKSHIKGAYASPAGYAGKSVPGWIDPVEGLPKDGIYITYCACPHHLSSIRASYLIKNGYKHAFALDEGFKAWKYQDLPLSAGSEQR